MRDLSSMKKYQALKVALFITILVLLVNAIAISRDYQDSWVLEGLEVPFVLFAITYVVAFFFETRTSWLVGLALIGRTVFLLLPNLKYVWFQGIYVDQHIQYALARYVMDEGHVAIVSSTSYTSTLISTYTTTPLMHLSFSIFSIVPGMPLVDAMKYLPILWSLMYPLMTCIIVRAMGFPKGSATFKYALLFSSIPFSMDQYVITGTLFASVFLLLILTMLVLLLQKKDRRYWLLFIFFVFALVTAHSVTPIILALSLLAIVPLQRVLRPVSKTGVVALAALAVACITGLWLVFVEGGTFLLIVGQIFVAVPKGATPPSEYISPAFFEHVRANLLSAVKSIIVFYGADALLLLLTVIALAILLKRRRKYNSSSILVLLLGCVFLTFIIIGYFMKLGAVRSLFYIGLLFPIFAAVCALQITKNAWGKKWTIRIVSLLLLLLATIELYGCQPLIDPANVLYKGLPANVPISYVGEVNTIYQRRMIGFIESHTKGMIAAWSPSIDQLIGLTDINFSEANTIWYNPLDESQPKQQYDYFLINLPGRSGVPSVAPPLRTADVILGAINNSSIAYTNGESYILVHNYP